MSDRFRAATTDDVTSSSQRRLRGLLAAAALVLSSLALGACERADDGGGDVVRRPAPVLTDDNMERLLGAIRDLKALGTAQAKARAVAAGVEDPHVHGPVGLGMSTMVEDALPILERWGFQDHQDFESLYGYANLALQQVVLGDDAGVGQASKRFFIQQKLGEYQERLDALAHDDALSAADREQARFSLERQIEELQSTLAEDEENSALMREQFERLPPENLAVMRKYVDQFVAVLQPHG